MRNMDRQQVVVICAASLIIGGFGVFKYFPILRQKHIIRKQMDQQAQVIDEVCSQSALLPELKYKHRQMQMKLKPFTQQIPQGRNFAQLWQKIADVMNAYNLKEQLVQPGSELKSDQLCSIPLRIECKGSLEQLFSFFKELENLDRLIRFEEIQFDNDQDLTGYVKMNVNAHVYYQPDSTDKG